MRRDEQMEWKEWLQISGCCNAQYGRQSRSVICVVVDLKDAYALRVYRDRGADTFSI